MLKRKLLRMLLIVPPIALGIVVFALVVGNKTPLPQAAVSEASRKVRVIEVPRLSGNLRGQRATGGQRPGYARRL
jgi:hypothetical protein